MSHNHPMSGPLEVVKECDESASFSNNMTDNNDTKKRYSTSLDLWGEESSSVEKSGPGYREDPPSKLIGVFLNKQRAAGGELPFDVDLEMEEFRHSPRFPPLHPNCTFPTSSTPRVPLDTHNSSACNLLDLATDEEGKQMLHNRRSSILDMQIMQNYSGGNVRSQVLKCTSSQRRTSNLGRMKTRSRLHDPPEAIERRSGMMLKSGQLRSGRFSGKQDEEEEDDPFEEDLPDELKQGTSYSLTVIQWISLVLIVATFVCTLSISKLKRRNFRGLSLWKWEVLVLVLICGRLVSGWGIRVAVFFIERNFFMRKRVLYFVYGVRKAVQNCVWLGLVLIAWHSMFDLEIEGSDEFLQYVNKLMICMLVGILLWLVKTLMVKVLASSFHVSTFFDRIQESLFTQYLIESLSGPPLIEISNNHEEEMMLMKEAYRLQKAGATLPPDFPHLQKEKSGKVGGGLPPKPVRGSSSKSSGQIPKSNDQNSNNDQGISIEHLQNLNHKNVSAWNMKRLMKVVKHGVITTLDERALGIAQGDETATQIRSEHEAIVAARNIFRNVAKPKTKFIFLEDLMRFLREDEALKTLNVVEGSVETGKISKASLKNWVVNTFIERRALALTLNDTKTAVDTLHRMVNIIVGIIIFITWLIILGIATSKFLVYLSSQVIVVAFIFGNTCRTIFEALIFVFVMHPFDVGDRCELDGVQMIVEEMNILTTVFLRYDNQKIIYPNVTLSTQPISNYYRSPDMHDTVDFEIHISTPAEKIAVIKQRITSYIENRSDHWYPAPSVVLIDMDELRTIKFSVWMRHRMNHQNMVERWKRREQLVDEMARIFREMDIEHRLHPVDINVREMPPLNSTRMPPAWATPAN